MLEEYHQKYGLIYSVNSGPHGVNNNFYRAISLCSKDYIAICDQDDIWLPEKVEITYNKLKEIDDGRPCVVSSVCNHIDANGIIIKTSPNAKETDDYWVTFLGQDRSQGCSLMFNRCLWDYIQNSILVDKRVDCIYDALISHTAAIIGRKYNLGNRLMLYRHHDSNVIAKAGLKVSFIQQIYNHEYYKLPYQRFALFEILYDLCKSDIQNPCIEAFLKRTIRISKSNHIVGYREIIKMPELSFKEKIVIILGTCGLDIIKMFPIRKS